jgi:hypothetical protein
MPHLVHRIHEVVIQRIEFDDKLVWTDLKDGCLTSKQAYRVLFSPTAAPDGQVFIWHSFIPPSNSFVVWRCFHNKMPTDENLIKRGLHWCYAWLTAKLLLIFFCTARYLLH